MKRLIYLITIFIAPCFGMGNLANFPNEVLEMILSWQKIDKSNPQVTATQLIQNIKQYNSIPKTVSKNFYSYINESFNRALERLNEQDFKNLNQYISDSLGSVDYFSLDKKLPKDFNLLIRLLKKLNKLDPAVSKKIDNTLIVYAGKNKLDNKLEEVQELIKSGADINAKDNDGLTALMKASIHGDTGMIKLLINNNADVNVKDEYGITPLMWASMRGHIDTVKLLINNNADINAKNYRGSTPLMFAKDNGHTAIVKVIEEHEKRAK